MGVVRQKDKRSGIAYAYEPKARWDEERRQSGAKGKPIGRVDEAAGEIAPTDGRVGKARERAAEPGCKAPYEQARAGIAGLEAEPAKLRG